MRARAPGKVVISGAYAVLRGAPAIVAAVDRDATADGSRAPDFVPAEIGKAVELGFLKRAPAFDSSAQRGEGRKLGLGSSAAILVASLLATNPRLSRDELFQRALLAHRTAQAGGSGIDVAASTYGGVLHYRLQGDGMPVFGPLQLPEALVVRVWSSPTEARTSELIARVSEAERQHPETVRELFERLAQACEAALGAARANDAAAFIAALRTQTSELAALGDLAGVPIVTGAVRALDAAAREQGAVVLPAGAGGGDVALFVAEHDPDPALLELCARCSHQPLQASLGAAGATLLRE
jgi:phosphomevalonate kinase